MTVRPHIPPRHTLAEVAGQTGGRVLGESATPLTGLTLASGEVEPGDLFVALQGANSHGARYWPAARAAGAVAALTDETGAALLGETAPLVIVPDPRAQLGELSAWFYAYPARDLKIGAITGTTGKTTTAYLLEAAMRAAWRHTALLGTIELRLDGRSEPSARTTLEAPDLEAAFAAMRETGVKGCAMEVSSHALALHRVDGFQAGVACFTNLARDHLDFHKTMEAYFEAKALAFTPEHAARAVICVDDEWGRRLARETALPPESVIRVAGAHTAGDGAADAAPDWVVRPLGLGAVPQPGGAHDGGTGVGSVGAAGTCQLFRLEGPGGAMVDGSTRLPGGYNVMNAAFALLMAVSLGIDPAVAAAGIAELDGVPGRMERVASPPGGPIGIVDFAHTPEAVATSLEAARAQTSGRLIAVLGAGGGRDPGKRELMGAAAARGADLVIVTDDNPRQEDPALIRAAVMGGAEGAAAGAELREVAGRGAAIALAVDLAGPGDLVAVLGKGHETTQTDAAGQHPWDDRVALADALAARAGRDDPEEKGRERQC